MQGGSGWTPPELKSAAVTEEYPFCHLRLGFLGFSDPKRMGALGPHTVPMFESLTSWWFQIFFIFIPTWGRFPF